MQFDKKLEDVLVVTRLHEAMDQAFYSIVNGRPRTSLFNIIKEELRDRGIKAESLNKNIDTRMLNENIMQYISGLFQKYGNKVAQAYIDKNPELKKQIASQYNKERQLQNLAKSVKSSFTTGIGSLAKQLYSRAKDNNTKTVIASLFAALNKGIEKWEPKLNRGGTPFNRASTGLDAPPAAKSQPNQATSGPNTPKSPIATAPSAQSRASGRKSSAFPANNQSATPQANQPNLNDLSGQVYSSMTNGW